MAHLYDLNPHLKPKAKEKPKPKKKDVKKMSKPTMQSLKTEIDNLKDTVQELKTSLRRIENWLLAGMGSITMLLVTQMFM